MPLSAVVSFYVGVGLDSNLRSFTRLDLKLDLTRRTYQILRPVRQRWVSQLTQHRTSTGRIFSQIPAHAVLTLAVAVVGILICARNSFAAGELELSVVDGKTGEPIAARIHLKDQRGRKRLVRGTVTHADHFCFDGKTVLRLPNGVYTFEIERGLEYRHQTGHFIIERGATDNKTITLNRFVDMKEEGWWSGDIDVARKALQMKTLMLAEDLHFANLKAWPAASNQYERAAQTAAEDRLFEVTLGRFNGGGGRLSFFGIPQLDGLSKKISERVEYPPSGDFLKRARKQDAFIDVSRPDSHDLPIWLASGMTTSICVLNGDARRDGVGSPSLNLRKPDSTLYPEPIDRIRWAHDIYYKILNCGLRIPPTAGSGSGETPNPVGYNRVYVHCGNEFTTERWWDGLQKGRSIITNGPMLRLRVNDHLPGHVFKCRAGEKLTLQTSLKLSTREKIEYLEIVKDGRPLHVVRLDEFVEKKGQLPDVAFDRSGWMMVRAVTNNANTYRYAASAPFYVEFEQPAISRRSAQFFLDWAKQRMKELQIRDETQSRYVLRYHKAAVKYWTEKVSAATVP